MTYKKLLYNEKDLGKYLFENGFTNNEYNKREAYILSKYMRHTFNYGDSKLKKEIVVFFEKYSNFNLVLEYHNIKKYIKKSNSDFIIKESISITKNEISFIRRIKNFKSQKIYLSLLALCKRNGYNYVSVRDYKIIKKISNINLKTDDLYDILHYLSKNSLTHPFDDKDKGCQKIAYIDWEGEPIITISTNSDFYKLGSIYETYCGGEIEYCSKCEREFFKKGKTHIYCENCSVEKEKERKRVFIKKQRQSL